MPRQQKTAQITLNGLDEIRQNLKTAQAPLLEVGETICCFAQSEKNWTMDPSGVKWETFRSLSETDEYGARTPSELGICVQT